VFKSTAKNERIADYVSFCRPVYRKSNVLGRIAATKWRNTDVTLENVRRLVRRGQDRLSRDEFKRRERNEGQMYSRETRSTTGWRCSSAFRAFDKATNSSAIPWPDDRQARSPCFRRSFSYVNYGRNINYIHSYVKFPFPAEYRWFHAFLNVFFVIASGVCYKTFYRVCATKTKTTATTKRSVQTQFPSVVNNDIVKRVKHT